MQKPRTRQNVPLAMSGRWPYESKSEPLKQASPKVKNACTLPSQSNIAKRQWLGGLTR